MRHSLAIACLFAICLGGSVVGPAHAEPLGKGRALILIGVGGHTGQFTYPGSSTIRLQSGEVGGLVSYSRFLNDEWTWGVSAGYYASRARIDENNPNGTPLGTESFDTRSFTIRLGVDRYAYVNDDVAVFAGPGVGITRGQAKSEFKVIPPATGGGVNKSPHSSEVGLNWRVGMYVRLGRNTALVGHIGYVLAHTWGGQGPSGESSWWSSTPEGAVGLALGF
jgi:hypothetical protein